MKEREICIKRLKDRDWLIKNYNFECNWLIELSDKNLASELGEIGVLNPIRIEEIVILKISEFIVSIKVSTTKDKIQTLARTIIY